MRTEFESVVNSNASHVQMLSHPFMDNDQEIQTVFFWPELKVSLFNQTRIVLLDSDASVSAISESLFRDLKTGVNKPNIPTFSLTGIVLSTALQGKNIKITSQVFLTFMLGENSFSASCLIVPGLATPFILGND